MTLIDAFYANAKGEFDIHAGRLSNFVVSSFTTTASRSVVRHSC